MKKDKQVILDEIKHLQSECGSILDAVITVCEKNNIEIETMAHYLKYSKHMRQSLYEEGVKLRSIKAE